jgi:hypothetical protein
MLPDELKLFQSVRAATQQTAGKLSEEQAAYSPGAGKWSIGEVLDHLLLADALYREQFSRVIELKKAGQRPQVRNHFAELDTSILFIPQAMLPLLEVPFRIVNSFLPARVREGLTRYRVMPAQSPTIALPRKGRPLGELREELKDSLAQTVNLFASHPGVDYRELRISHPLMGNNSVLQLVRIMALHEQRHQTQIRIVQRSTAFPRFDSQRSRIRIRNPV